MKNLTITNGSSCSAVFLLLKYKTDNLIRERNNVFKLSVSLAFDRCFLVAKIRS